MSYLDKEMKGPNYKSGSIFLVAMFVTVTAALFLPLDGIRAEVTIGLFAVLFIPFVYRLKYINTADRKLVFWLVLFVAIMILYDVLGISSAAPGYLMRYYGFVLFAVISCYLPALLDKTQRKILFYIIYGISFLSVLYMCVANVGMKYAADVKAQYGTMMMLFLGLSFMCWLKGKGMGIKIFSFLSVLISVFATFFVMQRAINILLSLLMIVLLLAFNTNRKKFSYVILMLLLSFATIVYQTGWYKDILLKVADVFQSERLSSRIQWIINALKRQDVASAGGSLSGRYDMLEHSLNTWTSSLKSFLVGVGDHRSGYIIGNHNELIDMLARYGIIGAGIVYAILIKYAKHVTRLDSARNFVSVNNQCLVIFVVFILRSLLGGTFFPDIAIQLFLFLPLVFERLTTKFKGNGA